MAGWTGLEPAASGVTGRRSNQLNYHPELKPVKVQMANLPFDLPPSKLVGGAGFEPATAGV